MTAPQNPRVTQADERAAQRVRQRFLTEGISENEILGQELARHREAAEAEVKAREDALREALESIRRWAEDAYGTDIFEEPDLDAVNRVLTENGLRGHMDRMHASWGRRLMQGVGHIARSALTKEPDA